MSPSDDALTVALDLARTFRDAKVSYAIGGALAYSIWATPRATLDVDRTSPTWPNWSQCTEKSWTTGYVRRWMVEMMGEDDERIPRWDRIVASQGREL